MDGSGQIFRLSQDELVTLSAFFLALPLPPVLNNDTVTPEKNLERGLKQAAAALEAKGWIISDGSNSVSVLPPLAEMLRDMAYGNQMVHIFIHRYGETAQQIAFYRIENRVARQELTRTGDHLISREGENLGRDAIMSLLEDAPTGREGARVQFPVEAWHYLLSSRVARIVDQVQAQGFSTAIGGDALAVAKRRFAQDVLQARLVMELTCVYDRLGMKTQKAAFVISEDTNWLAIPSSSATEAPALWAIEVSRNKLTLALAGMFADFQHDISAERRAK